MGHWCCCNEQDEYPSYFYSSYRPRIADCACCGGDSCEISIDDAHNSVGVTGGLGCCLGPQYEDLIGSVISLYRCYCHCDPETGEMEMGWQGCSDLDIQVKCANNNTYDSTCVVQAFVYCTYVPGETAAGTWQNIKRIQWGVRVTAINGFEEVASTCPAPVDCEDVYDPESSCEGSHVTCTAGLDNTLPWPQEGTRGWAGGGTRQFTACDGVEGCDTLFFEAEDLTEINAGSIQRITLTMGAHSEC